MTKKGVLIALAVLVAITVLVGMPILTAVSAASTRNLLIQEIKLSVKVFKSQEQLLEAFTGINDRLDSINEQLGANNNQLSEIQKSVKELKVIAQQKQEVTPVKPDLPVKNKIELVPWTDDQAKELMKKLYPGDSKYRDPVFTDIMVYPLSWYNSVLPNIPLPVLRDVWPGSLIAWFNNSSSDIATGYVWVLESNVWRIERMVPAHKDGVVGFYYLVDGIWLEAGSDQDKITPLVKAVNLIK